MHDQSMYAQVYDELWTFKNNEPIIECVALVCLGKTAGDDARDSFELQRSRGLLAARASAEIKSGNNHIALLVERVEIRCVIFECYRGHLLRRHVVAVRVFTCVNAIGVQIVFVDKENPAAYTSPENLP